MEYIEHTSGLHGAVASLIGGREENQDSYLIGETPLGLLVAVCDGMGGGPAGKTASAMAADAMLGLAMEATQEMDPEDVLRAIAKGANEVLRRAQDEDPALRGMGTTCVALIVTGGKGYMVHVGDSRCYQLRGGRAIFRTADHSMVGELVRKGALTEEQARNSGYSNVITQALGGADEVRPEVDVVEVKPGDRFALMTDGIWGAVEEERLVGALAQEGDLAAIVDYVATRVDEIGYEKGGGHDNLTLAMIELPPVETVVPYTEMPDETAAEEETWQVTDESDPTGAYVIEDEVEEGAAAPAAEKAEERDGEAARQPMPVAGGRTLAEKVAAEVAKKKSEPAVISGSGIVAGSGGGNGAKTAPAVATANPVPEIGVDDLKEDKKTGEEREEEKGKKKRKISGWWIFAACAGVVVLGLLGSTIYLYLHPVERGSRIAMADSTLLAEATDSMADSNATDGEEDPWLMKDDDFHERVDKESRNPQAPAMGLAEGREGNSGISQERLDALNALMSDGAESQGHSNQQGSARGSEGKSSSIGAVQQAIKDLIGLRDEKGQQLAKGDPGYNERLERRRQKINQIVRKLEKCRSELPESQTNKRQKLDYVAKELSGSSAALIDVHQGYPTADAIKAINYYLNILREI